MLINNKFWVYFMQNDNNDTNSKSVCLLSKILQELQNAMKRMAPSLLEEDGAYEQWKCVANKGQYQFLFLGYMIKESSIYMRFVMQI